MSTIAEGGNIILRPLPRFLLCLLKAIPPRRTIAVTTTNGSIPPIVGVDDDPTIGASRSADN